MDLLKYLALNAGLAALFFLYIYLVFIVWRKLSRARLAWKVVGSVSLIVLNIVLLFNFVQYPDLFFRVPIGAIRDHFHPPPWETLLSADLPGNGVVKFRHRVRLGRTRVDHSIRWYAPTHSVFDYALGSGRHSVARHPELRATKDYKRIWIVDREWATRGREAASESTGVEHSAFWKGIKATLDTTTVECISSEVTIVDPSLPLNEQLRAAKNVKSGDFPNWATPDGGILLDERDLAAEGKNIHRR